MRHHSPLARQPTVMLSGITLFLYHSLGRYPRGDAAAWLAFIVNAAPSTDADVHVQDLGLTEAERLPLQCRGPTLVRLSITTSDPQPFSSCSP